MKQALSVYLDILRIAAAFAVFFNHANHFTGHFGLLAGFSSEAVALFFVLSGFVIAYVAAQRENSAYAYATARLARLYSVAIPALFIVLAFDMVGHAADPGYYDGMPYYNPEHGPFEIMRCLTFTNEWWDSHVIFGSDEPYWSLGFEANYYLIYGLFLFLPLPLAGRLAAMALALLIAGPKIAAYPGLWLTGVVLYQACARCGAREPSIPGRLLWGIIWLAAPLCWIALQAASARLLRGGFSAIYGPFSLSAPVLNSLGYFYALAALFFLHIFAFARVAGSAALTSFAEAVAGPVRWIAGATFTFYLIHEPVLIAYVAILPRGADSSVWAASVVLCTLLTVLAAAGISERRKAFWQKLIRGLIPQRA